MNFFFPVKFLIDVKLGENFAFFDVGFFGILYIRLLCCLS